MDKKKRKKERKKEYKVIKKKETYRSKNSGEEVKITNMLKLIKYFVFP